MSVDLDRLLGSTADSARLPLDADALWTRGRRRRRFRQSVTGGAVVIVLAAGGLGVAEIVTHGVGPGITPAGPRPAAPGGPADADLRTDDFDPLPELFRGPYRPEPDVPVVVEAEPEAPAPPHALPDPPPLPDPARVAVPCAGHEQRTAEAFIDVVSPVPGMRVGEQTKFIGCANVYEATVNWRVVDAAGAPLRDGFVTATCGTGCVGEFSDLIDLDGLPDGAILQVFWVDDGDGSDGGLVEIRIESD